MRTAILILLLACGSSGAESDPASAPITESEPVEAEPEAEVEAEAEPEPAPPYSVVPPPDTFYFVDNCWRARGATREEALAECRRVRRTDRWSRRWCLCEDERVFEASPEKATLYHGCCGVVAATPQLAHQECRHRLEEEWCELEEGESADVIDPVWGPYERQGPFGEFDDAHYRYIALISRDSYWVDETGAPPCFPDGTRVMLEGGERHIEDVRIGDRVLAMNDAGELSHVPVLRVKVRRADELVVLDLGERRLRVTPRHPLLANDEWVFAGAIQPGDRLATPDGSVEVRGVSSEHGPVRVRTLSVGAPHVFFAEGVLAHNY